MKHNGNAMKTQLSILLFLIALINTLPSSATKPERKKPDFPDRFHKQSPPQIGNNWENGNQNNKRVKFLSENEFIVYEVFAHYENDPDLKFEYDYGHNQLITSEMIYQFEDGSWNNQFRNTFSYDQDMNLLSELSESWEENQWRNILRRSFKYDSLGNLIEQTGQKWEDSLWINFYRYLYNYLDSTRIDYIQQKWVNGNWANMEKWVRSFNNKGLLTTELKQRWADYKWENANRFLHFYDTSGNRISFTQDHWRWHEWHHDWREEYSYDADNNVVMHLYMEMNEDKWEKIHRQTYSYSNDGKMLTSLYEEQNGGQWQQINRKFNTYDVHGNLIDSLHQRWYHESWNDHERIILTYDDNQNLIIRLKRIWNIDRMIDHQKQNYFYNENHNLIKFNSYEYRNGNWEITDGRLAVDSMYKKKKREYYGYEIIINWQSLNSTKGVAASAFSTNSFPNPFSSAATIEYSIEVSGEIYISIFDILGKRVERIAGFREAGKHRETFDATGLAPGMYFYTVRAGGQAASGKMLLAR